MKLAVLALIAFGLSAQETPKKPEPKKDSETEARIALLTAQRDFYNAQVAYANAIFAERQAKDNAEAMQKAVEKQLAETCRVVPALADCPKAPVKEEKK